MSADEREYGRSDKGERQADKIRAPAMRLDAIEYSDGRAQGGNLRQGKIDKNDTTLDDVDPQVGVNAGEDQAGHEGREKEIVRVHLFGFESALTSRLMS